ncbi:SDR family oxidoreductase [Hyalangium rubrum]|uniref:SDR family oxidoreductase n=1 Tax=Hyalangium rubrum TaxID=3103134 RepID=A0ABU5HBP8_9BACT|nr:SDR family oxidoreductase [Hyalangium sp. s54d21]MDY7230232.1 SDR family oxidoreductase [Hyalangium sp. s54d21]
MKRAWKGKVIVITGASSGIGRATALVLAKKGAHLVLAARREEPLDELAQQCEALGIRCLSIPTDVSEADAVRALAAQAVQAFGRIDGWVNNAGVYLLGRLEETPDEAFRQVMETNFFGTVYGARAALAQFRRQGRGTLVNVSSVFGSTAGPYVSAYAASKFAVRGFSSSIRQEFEGTGIHVCTVLPAAVDTPLWQHSANYTGWRLRPVEPIYSPERVARAIARVLERPRRELFIGPSRRVFAALHTLLPWASEKAMRSMTESKHFEDRRQSRTSGNLFQPMAQGTGRSAGYRSPARLWFKRLLLAGGLLASVASLRRSAAGRRLGLRVVEALGA